MLVSNSRIYAWLSYSRYFPEKQTIRIMLGRHRFHLAHFSLKSDLLKGKTLCIKDNVCVAGVPCLLGTETFTGWTPKMDATIVTGIRKLVGQSRVKQYVRI